MAHTPQPFVAIVVAAYNSRDTIGRCLDHLQALDYPRRKIIVVDNASTDGTRDIAAARPVAILDEPRRGWPAARNRAWHHSKARLVANIDADCFAEPAWLAELVAALLADPRAGCAVGRTKVEPGRTLAQRVYAASDPFNFERFLDGSKVHTPSWGGGNNLFRREVFEAVGGYDARTYTSGADREFHRRFEARTPYRTIYVPTAVVWHVARGSLRELFAVTAKYETDAVLHAQFDAGLADRVRGSVARHLRALARNAFGLAWRAARFLIGRETALRVAQPFFWNVQALGAIWGHLRGRRRLAAARRRRRESEGTPSPGPAVLRRRSGANEEPS